MHEQRRPYFYGSRLGAPFGINDFPREVKLKDDTPPALSDFSLYSSLKQKLRQNSDCYLTHLHKIFEFPSALSR